MIYYIIKKDLFLILSIFFSRDFDFFSLFRDFSEICRFEIMFLKIYTLILDY